MLVVPPLGGKDGENFTYYVHYQNMSQIGISFMATESICSAAKCNKKEWTPNGENRVQGISFTLIVKQQSIIIGKCYRLIQTSSQNCKNIHLLSDFIHCKFLVKY